MTAKLRLNHISIQVRQLETSAQFYRDVMLLPEIECGARKPNIRWFGLGPGQSVHLIEGETGSTLKGMTTHFCVSSPDWQGMLRHLREKDAVFCNLAGKAWETHTRADGVRSVYLQDPDGYWIEVNEDY
jgi:catechol 2,3-dioxygenase-like lactoylglutathione lyase family enzyme